MERTFDTNLILNDVYDNMDGTIRLRRFDSNYIFNAIYDPDAPGLRVNKIVDMNSTDLNDMPKPLEANKYLKVNNTGDAYVLSDIEYSAGIITKPTFNWDYSTGLLTIYSDGVYQVFSDDNYSLPIQTITGLDAQLYINDLKLNYVVLNWNSGSPTIKSLKDRNTINQSDVIPLFTIYREGKDIHYLDWDQMGKGLSNKLCDRLVRTERFAKETGGLFLSEGGSRDIQIADGVVWYGASYVFLEGMKSSSSSAELYHHSLGVWIKQTIKEYDNFQYDNGTDLVSLSPNKYAVNYIFRFVEKDNHMAVILGGGNYNYGDAINSLIPEMPEIISTQCIYVGKIVVKQGENIATKIIQADSNDNGVSSVTDHSLLSNLYWPSSGHTGYVNRVAVFDDNGNANTDSSLIWDYANKRLGIGITPTTKFHVNGLMTATGYYNQVSGFVEGNIFKNPYGQSYGYIRFGATNFSDKDMIISTNNVERLRILSDGKVGINNAAPLDSLDVKGTARFGDSTTNYTQFEADGSMKMVGTATVFDDLTGDITRTKTVGTRVTLNDTENTIDFANNSALTDYLFLNYQMSHKWKSGSDIFPHIHYEQTNNNVPNFLFQYRWQRQGQTKTTTWTNAKCNVNIFTYTSGTLNQIVDSVSITPPTGYGMSDIIEFRVIRDTANASGLFAGADTYTGTVSLTSVDIHYEISQIGSKTEYGN